MTSCSSRRKEGNVVADPLFDTLLENSLFLYFSETVWKLIEQTTAAIEETVPGDYYYMRHVSLPGFSNSPSNILSKRRLSCASVFLFHINRDTHSSLGPPNFEFCTRFPNCY